MNATTSRYVISNPRPGVYWVRDVLRNVTMRERATLAEAEEFVTETLAADKAIVLAQARVSIWQWPIQSPLRPDSDDSGRCDEDSPDAGWVDDFNGQWSKP